MNDELTPAVLAELRGLLEHQRDQLSAAVGGRRRAEGADDTPDEDESMDVAGDSADASVDLEAWDTSHQEQLNLRTQLAEVEHALTKFAAGTYGICEECGRPIPLARLRIVPAARYDAVHETDVEARP